nr:hypothetical protein [Tanacetum cinerariifolium]
MENLDAYEMLHELKTLFSQQVEQELLQTMREFHSYKQEEGQSISSYVLKMKSNINNVEHLGHPVSLGLGVSKVQRGNKKHKKPQPQLAVGGQNQGKRKNKLAYAPKPKIPPPPKREDPAKDSICHQCGETGHWKRNCSQYLAEFLKNKKLSQGASGSGALSLYVGNGQCAAVEAIGSYHLSLPSGLVIVLNNCYYAPSITRGIISVSCLYDDGYVNGFVDNSIQDSRNNMVYFSVVPRDGIFEIDLSYSYTNVSSMYALSIKRAKSNLNSALLWHRRLRHISKKRIKKLQHDRLLNSAELKAFEKCIPYMPGKIARKPYTHQVKRAKDLLRLIHTDVCGPFKIVSRPGASYFVTFTDDFSRYGYVYLLKHKHEVFETFKVFQKEVENQLDTSLIHEEDDLEIDEPQSDIIPIHRSTRTRHAPDRMCLYIDADKHELGDLGEPANYKAALLDPEYDKWLNAMNVEINWLFKKKTNMDGAVHTYKARLVVKGYTQTPRIDYKETFSLVSYIRAIRILIAITAFYDYEIWKIDVKTAFLNGYLFEEVYMEKPEGFVNPKYPNRTGYVFVLNGGDVDWKSAKQSIFGTSSAEAEYIAAYDASNNAVWVRNSFIGLVLDIFVPKFTTFVKSLNMAT